jgi:hypothetical protein
VHTHGGGQSDTQADFFRKSFVLFLTKAGGTEIFVVETGIIQLSLHKEKSGDNIQNIWEERGRALRVM